MAGEELAGVNADVRPIQAGGAPSASERGAARQSSL